MAIDKINKIIIINNNQYFFYDHILYLITLYNQELVNELILHFSIFIDLKINKSTENI